MKDANNISCPVPSTIVYIYLISLFQVRFCRSSSLVTNRIRLIVSNPSSPPLIPCRPLPGRPHRRPQLQTATAIQTTALLNSRPPLFLSDSGEPSEARRFRRRSKGGENVRLKYRGHQRVPVGIAVGGV